MNITINSKQRYYTVNGQKEKIKYSTWFPLEWALYDTFVEPIVEKKDNANQYVGSISCANCQKYGTFRGVFIQYCKNCVKERRPGCNCVLQEIIPPKITTGELFGYHCNNANCIFKSYLMDVNLCQIGLKNEKRRKKTINSFV